uniref:Uncharacterized protein n=1 Tax=viral metagenome TaxID=1070528 RepID=A0A6M3K9T3_9ZZZZ
MKLYRISQEVNNDYDTYDSAVVCAESESEARIIVPGGEDIEFGGEKEYWMNNVWTVPESVSVEYLGEARPDLPKGVVLASFNAG